MQSTAVLNQLIQLILSKSITHTVTKKSAASLNHVLLTAESVVDSYNAFSSCFESLSTITLPAYVRIMVTNAINTPTSVPGYVHLDHRLLGMLDHFLGTCTCPISPKGYPLLGCIIPTREIKDHREVPSSILTMKR